MYFIRRIALRYSAKPGICFFSLLLLFLAGALSTADEQEVLDVIIIGAGWAGMAAADHLIRNAPQVTLVVLESSDHTGGRTHAVTVGKKKSDGGLGEYVIETGSNWICGTPKTGSKHSCSSAMDGEECPNVGTNKVADLAQRIGLGMVPRDVLSGPLFLGLMSKVDMVYNSQGQNGDPTGIIGERFKAAVQCVSEMIKSEQSDPSLTFRQAMSQCGWTPQTDVEWAIDLASTECSGAENDVEMAESMFAGDATFDLWGYNDLLVMDQNPRGYAQALDEMVKDTIPPGDPRVVFNAHVRNIDFASGCEPASSVSDIPVKITTEDGRVFFAKEVISTIPLGVLQRHHRTLFTPSLPNEIIDTLSSGEVEMRNVTRVVLQFPTVWWDNSLTRWVSANEGANDTASADHFSRWRNLNHEKVMPGSHIIFSFLGDPQSSHYEALPEADVESAVMKQLRRQHPNIKIPDPTDIFITRHGYDRTRYGAFLVQRSNWTGDFERAFDMPVADCNGIKRLHWAGDAFCGELSGYTHSALYSGVTAAAWYLYYHDLGPNPDDDDYLGLCDRWMEGEEDDRGGLRDEL